MLSLYASTFHLFFVLDLINYLSKLLSDYDGFLRLHFPRLIILLSRPEHLQIFWKATDRSFHYDQFLVFTGKSLFNASGKCDDPS